MKISNMFNRIIGFITKKFVGVEKECKQPTKSVTRLDASSIRLNDQIVLIAVDLSPKDDDFIRKAAERKAVKEAAREAEKKKKLLAEEQALICAREASNLWAMEEQKIWARKEADRKREMHRGEPSRNRKELETELTNAEKKYQESRSMNLNFGDAWAAACYRGLCHDQVISLRKQLYQQ